MHTSLSIFLYKNEPVGSSGQYIVKALTYCRRKYRKGNRPEAEELYQDTFLKTLELLDKIQKDGNPKSYLLSVAIRIWKNRNRKI